MNLCALSGQGWHPCSIRREGRRLADINNIRSKIKGWEKKLYVSKVVLVLCALLFQGDPGLRGDAGPRGEQGTRGEPGSRGLTVGSYSEPTNSCQSSNLLNVWSVSY